MSDSSSGKLMLRSRFAQELKQYFAVSLYLFICFGVIMLYEVSQSSAKEATLLGSGMVLVKALVVGKFILIGEVLKAGTRVGAPTLLHRVAWRTLGLLLVLIILKIVEELVIGIIHGEAIGAIVSNLLSESLLSMLGPVVLMLLILVPMILAIELNRALGGAGLKGLLLSRDNE